MKTVYSVISLPRTGTKSICKMANICGLHSCHGPLWSLKYHLFQSKFNFFADTPMYSPDFVNFVGEQENLNVKFIYIEKSPSAIFESWEKVGLHRNYIGLKSDRNNLKYEGEKFDIQILDQTFNSVFPTKENFEELYNIHRATVQDIVKCNNREILFYDFADGWAPFCEYINTDIPSEEIPHLNINTMFDKI